MSKVKSYYGGSTSHYYTYNGSTLVQEKIVTSGSQTTEYLTFLYNGEGPTGFVYNNTLYTYRKNIFGDIIAIYQGNTKVAEYAYDAYGNCTIVFATGNAGILNPFRYRGYYYDSDIELYYLQSRYYDPETGRFINADDVSYLDPETIHGLNLYTYCLNNPVMYVDPSGHAPWWSWLISGLQVLGGIALCFVPGAQGIGLALFVGGAFGLIANAVSPAIGQAIGGASSIANGWGAFSTGMSILSLGIPGLIGGIALMLVGGATMAFGANEIVAAATGTNYIQQWTGMSDTAYGWTYFGLNLLSSVGQIAGNAYYLESSKSLRVGHTGKPKGFRYKTKNGKMFDFDYPHGNIRENHFHGWNGPGLTGRTSGKHWKYLRFIWWLISGR